MQLPHFWPDVFTVVLTGLLCSMMPSSLVLGATEYYVSTNGNDTHDGSVAKPWRSIQKAADSATPGSTVRVLAGKYPEQVVVRVSGNATQGKIIFQGEKGTILDFASSPITTGERGAFQIDSRSYIRISGFEIRNYVAKVAGATPIGICIRGACRDIEISGNLIHHITNNINANSNAHGIAVFGTGRTEAAAIRNLLISNNELHTLKLGASEAVVVNGNVNGFTIDGNNVHDCNNIAIDAIGFEGTSIAPFDQARNGTISNNTVTRIDSRGNPAYGNDRSADGIYIDGGHSITINKNTVSLCNIGIEVTSEHRQKFASEITITNNIVTRCHTVGLSFGGYDRLRGGTRNCIVKDNTFRGNDTDNNGSGEFQLQYLVQNNTVKNNVFSATSQNILISNAFTTTSGNTFDLNTYFAPGGSANSIWVWKNREYSGFAVYQQATKNDLNSRFGRP